MWMWNTVNNQYWVCFATWGQRSAQKPKPSMHCPYVAFFHQWKTNIRRLFERVSYRRHVRGVGSNPCYCVASFLTWSIPYCIPYWKAKFFIALLWLITYCSYQFTNQQEMLYSKEMQTLIRRRECNFLLHCISISSTQTDIQSLPETPIIAISHTRGHGYKNLNHLHT